MLFPFMNPMMLIHAIATVSPWNIIFSGFTSPVISGGKCNAVGCASICEQVILTNGVTYDFSFDYSKTGGSKLRVATGPNTGNSIVFLSGALANGSGTLSGTFVSGGSYFRIEADSALFDGTIDNVVVTTGGGANLISDPGFDIPNP